MLMGNIQSLDVQIPHEIAQNWGWFLALGILLLVLGVAAVVRSVAATVISMLFFGWVLLFSSGVEIAQAVMVGHWAGFFQHLVAAILFGVHCRVLPDRRIVSVHRSAGGDVGWMGLARGRRNHHRALRRAGAGAMAGLGALGHRPVCRHRLDIVRRHLDRGGAAHA